jgi:hypothetical protein
VLRLKVGRNVCAATPHMRDAWVRVTEHESEAEGEQKLFELGLPVPYPNKRQPFRDSVRLMLT